MAEYCGFPEDQFDLVFIILDKMDKIGWDGVQAELVEAGFSVNSVANMLECLTRWKQAKIRLDIWKQADRCTGSRCDWEPAAIRQSVEATKAADFELVFDPTLVRGMSYYTGTIFEIEDAGVRKLCGRRRPL